MGQNLSKHDTEECAITDMDSQTSADTRFPHPRRVVTEPTPSSGSRRSLLVSSSSSRSGALGGSKRPEDLVETLYNHPSVKIISFTACQRNSLGPGSAVFDDPLPGSLPASSKLERTIAIGPFRIYRAPGSVAFLSCGSALQPILPKSQCWCIDEANSQFVLQIRRPQYWRIELPISAPDEVQCALVLKEVLDQILQFEKTQCPFQRSFTVKLPERPQTPVRKRPWSAAGKNLVTSPFSSDLSPPSPSPKLVSGRRRSTVTTLERVNSSDLEPITDAETQQFGAASSEETSNGDKSPAASVASEPSNTSVAESYQNPPDATAGQPISDAESATAVAAKDEQASDSNVRGDLGSTGREESNEAEKSLLIPAAPIRDAVNGGADTDSKDGIMRAAQRNDLETSKELCKTPQGTKEASEVTSSRKPSNRKALEGPTKVEAARIDSVMFSSGPDLTSRNVREDKVPSSASSSQGEILGDVVGDGPSFEGSGGLAPVNLKKKRKSRVLAGRAVTLPPQLTLITSPPSKNSQKNAAEKPTQKSEEMSPVGSTDSFHSVQSWHSPITLLSPSPPSSRPDSPSVRAFPYPHENIVVPKREGRIRDASDFAITPGTEATFVPSSAGGTTHTRETASPFSRSTDDNCVMSTEQIRPASSYSLRKRVDLSQRPGSSPNNLSISRHALSPLPPAANFFSSPIQRRPPSRLEVVRKLPATIMHKTVEILMSPPSHLVNLMLKVAAKIAAGEWRGLVMGLSEGGESIPVHWDYSDAELSNWSDEEEYTFVTSHAVQVDDRDVVPRPSLDCLNSPDEDCGSWEVD